MSKSGWHMVASSFVFQVVESSRAWAAASGSGTASWWRKRDPCQSFLVAAKEETSFA